MTTKGRAGKAAQVIPLEERLAKRVLNGDRGGGLSPMEPVRGYVSPATNPSLLTIRDAMTVQKNAS